jgi:hypothetical protein
LGYSFADLLRKVRIPQSGYNIKQKKTKMPSFYANLEFHILALICAIITYAILQNKRSVTEKKADRRIRMQTFKLIL